VSIEDRIVPLLERHPAIREVRLVGSRARSEATALSDWDFLVVTNDVSAVARDLPSLVRPLGPLAQQWDRLSRRKNYMLIAPGPTKVDLLFEQPNEPEGSWRVSDTTLPRIDDHFWDWILWIAAKQAAGHRDLVASELEKLFTHLLQPMQVTGVPGDIEEAVAAYKAARRTYEDRFRITIPPDLKGEIERALRQHGFRV
jgi:predicted nucleotidyltransferase